MEEDIVMDIIQIGAEVLEVRLIGVDTVVETGSQGETEITNLEMDIHQIIDEAGVDQEEAVSCLILCIIHIHSSLRLLIIVGALHLVCL